MSEFEWIGLAMLLIPGVPLFAYAVWFIGSSIREEWGLKGLVAAAAFVAWVVVAAALMIAGSHA